MTGRANAAPRIVGSIRRLRSADADDVRFHRAGIDRRLTITIPGPLTMTQQTQDAEIRDDEAPALDFATAVSEAAQPPAPDGSRLLSLAGLRAAAPGTGIVRTRLGGAAA